MTALPLLALLLAEPVADPCAAADGDRAPDPRCGEALDGRAPPEPSTARKVGQAALAVPRVATQVVLWPVIKTADVAEDYHVVSWARAVLTSDDGLVGVRPELQYSTSFVASGGARFFYRRLPGPGSEIMLRARTGGSSIMLGEVGLRGPDRSGLSLLATFDRRNDRLFAGVGPRTDADLAAAGEASARYASDNYGAGLRWSRRLLLHLVPEAHADLQRRDYLSSGVTGGPSVADVFGASPAACAARGLATPCVDEAVMPGFARGLRIAHLGAGAMLDLRSPARDGRGFSLATDATIGRGVAGDPTRLARLSAEGVGALGVDDRVFLLRARAMMVERLSAAPIPFDELVIPSGQFDMRGFATGRLRGESGLVGSAEYRWYIAAMLDATLFADIGTVAGPRFSNIDWDRWFPSFGLGFRFYRPQGAYWDARAQEGIQIAYAPEGGLRLLFTMAAF
jgi:surface antigen Omp85-like protein